MVSHPSTAPPRSDADTSGGVFYAAMSLLVAGVIVLGFGHDAEARLFHRHSPRPQIVSAIIYAHAFIFSGFVALFVAQCVLVRAGDVAAHRALGGLGVAIGAAIPPLGIAAAVVAGRDGALPRALLAPQVQDMVAFSATFGLAVLCRKRSQYHRRLMLLALCCLTSGAFGRLPSAFLPASFLWFYAGVDLLILLGVVRDLATLRRIHPVYAVGLPTMLLAQTAALQFAHLV